MNNIAFVTLRIGSLGIPQKNIKDFCGKPLCFWVLNELQKSNASFVYVLTDSYKIARIVKGFDLNKVRIEMVNEMNSQSMTDDVVHKFIKEKIHSFNLDDNLMIAQVTSPLTVNKDYDHAFQMMDSKEFGSIVSVTQSMRFLWDIKTGDPVNHLKGIRLRRQDYPNSAIENGALYLTKLRDFLKSGYRINGKVGFHVMLDYTSCEIDTEADWGYCEALFRKNLLKPVINRNIKMLVSDLDGVLTDSGVYIDEHGVQTKKFSYRDGQGIELLQKAGIKFAIITAGLSTINEHRFKKRTIKADHLVQGSKNKFQDLKELTYNEGFSLSEIAYIGDDVLDIECLKNVGLSACPKDSNPKVKELPDMIVLNGEGGNCVREFIDLILDQ